MSPKNEVSRQRYTILPHFDGMLTRHWYDLDSVVETISFVAGTWRDPLRKQKLLFWTYELVLSEEWDRLWVALERIAKRWGDSACLAALSRRQDAQDVLTFLQRLLALPTPPPYDPPSAAPLQKALPSLPDTPATWTAEQRARLWWAVQDAVAHRHPLRLLRLLGGLPPATASRYLGAQGTGIYHMLEILELPALPAPCAITWPQLAVGRIAARLFAIPRHLLPTGAFNPAGPNVEDGCAFWRRIWTTCDADTVWNEYFLDDLPDEWPAAERTKSHH